MSHSKTAPCPDCVDYIEAYCTDPQLILVDICAIKAERDALKAKLAFAMDALETIQFYTHDEDAEQRSATALAKINGGNNEPL